MSERGPAWAFPWTLLRHHKASLAGAILWSVLFIVMPMQIPILAGALVDGLNGIEPRIYDVTLPARSPTEMVRTISALLLAVAAACGVSAYFRQASRTRIVGRLIAEARQQLTAKMETMSLDLHQRFGAGDLLNRVLVDAALLRQFVEGVVVQAATHFVRVVYPLAMIFWIQPQLALVACSVLPAQWLVTRLLHHRLPEAVRAARRSRSELTALLKEQLDRVETLQNLGAVESAVTQSARQIQRLEQAESHVSTQSACISATIWMFTSLGFALSWWFGALQVLHGAITIGDLVVFTGLVAFLYAAFRRSTDVTDLARRIGIGLLRVKEILDLPPTLREAPRAKPLEITRGVIECRNVSFAYGRQNALTNVNLRIEPHTITAIAGRRGSGKSSLLRLITRAYDPLDGQVLIDGQDLRRVTIDSLRSQVAPLPQRPSIFTGTIAENLRLAKPDATFEEIEQACRAANALEFIERLPLGFDTPLGRGGANLSGGEIQRLGIARAVLMKSKILLLDEPTSALDPASQAALGSALQQLTTQMTILIAARSIEALNCSERLVVLDRGRVVEQGSRRESLSSPSLYALLYEAHERSD